MSVSTEVLEGRVLDNVMCYLGLELRHWCAQIWNFSLSVQLDISKVSMVNKLNTRRDR